MGFLKKGARLLWWCTPTHRMLSSVTDVAYTQVSGFSDRCTNSLIYLLLSQTLLFLLSLCGVVSLPVLQVLRESKALMRNTSRSALEQANERECEALKRVWGSSQGTDAILQYLQRRTELC